MQESITNITKAGIDNLFRPVMGFASSYLSKHSYFKNFIVTEPVNGTALIVVIPSYNEPDVLTSVRSLYNADRPSFPVEVIIVVNSPVNPCKSIVKQNHNTVTGVRAWSRKHCNDNFMVHVIDVPPFPRKHAGAGFARKTGMDEALRRFNMLDNDRGIIVSFDADSSCDRNYFTELENCFSSTEISGCNIYFEHPLCGKGESSVIYRAIAEYELYLRYFVQAMRLAGFPFAFHTLGSCFAVNAKIYALQGGMNRRKAGEDFYFLHKIIPLGNFTELNSTRVMPSSRVSDRVPFGTGATMKRLTENNLQVFRTYPLQSFDELANIFSSVTHLFGADEKKISNIVQDLPECLSNYLKKNDFINNVIQMNVHSAAMNTFRKRFFTWFNAFRLLKFLNYARDNCRDDEPVSQNAADLLARFGVHHSEKDKDKLLFTLRKIQKNTVWRC